MKRRVTYWVLGLHGLFLLWMVISPQILNKKAPKHLVVRMTVQKEMPKQVAVAAAPPKKSAPKPAPVKKAAPPKPVAAAPKKTTKKAAPPTAPAKSGKPAPKKKALPKDLLQDLEESIAKIDKNRDKYYPESKAVTKKVEEAAPSQESERVVYVVNPRSDPSAGIIFETTLPNP